MITTQLQSNKPGGAPAPFLPLPLGALAMNPANFTLVPARIVNNTIKGDAYVSHTKKHRVGDKVSFDYQGEHYTGTIIGFGLYRSNAKIQVDNPSSQMTQASAG